MRKIIPLICCLSLLNLPMPQEILAQTEPVQPYRVTTQINHQPVDQAACSILLKKTDSLSQATPGNEVSLQSEAGENRLAEINARVQAINEEIAYIESDSPDSIAQATLTLEELVEDLYQSYLAADESFTQLPAEEQLALIGQEPVLLEWQAYLESLNQMVNQLVNERVTLETEAQEIKYQSELIESEAQLQESSLAQFNQCQLYAYSAHIMNVDHLMLNQENSSLSQYLVQIDQYLQQLVPLAYQKVSFEDIHQLYNRRLTQEQIALILNGKENMVVDAHALDQYSYAKELSLFDVELLASMALWQLNQHNAPQSYLESYQAILQLKEKQLAYFYDLNAPVFEKIKSDLAQYLNQHQHIDDEAVSQMQALHQRYQLKLVLYDPVSISWSPVAGAQSVYLDYYSNLNLAPLEEGEVPILEEETAEEERTSEADSASYLMPPLIEDESESQTLIVDNLDTNDNLAYLKDKLAQQKPLSSQTDSLIKPDSSNISAGLKDETADKASEDKKDKAKLPSTGEQRFYMWLTGGLMTLGLGLLAFNRYLKYRQRKNSQPVELD